MALLVSQRRYRLALALWVLLTVLGVVMLVLRLREDDTTGSILAAVQVVCWPLVIVTQARARRRELERRATKASWEQ